MKLSASKITSTNVTGKERLGYLPGHAGAVLPSEMEWNSETILR